MVSHGLFQRAVSSLARQPPSKWCRNSEPCHPKALCKGSREKDRHRVQPEKIGARFNAAMTKVARFLGQYRYDHPSAPEEFPRYDHRRFVSHNLCQLSYASALTDSSFTPTKMANPVIFMFSESDCWQNSGSGPYRWQAAPDLPHLS